MKIIVFDSGPIISFALNGILWLLPELKEVYNGRFVFPPSVKKEVIDRPLQSRKFGFEALRVNHLLARNVLEVQESAAAHSQAEELLRLANSSFEAHGTFMNLVQFAEIEALALARELHAEAVVIDERTTRMLVEAPENLKSLLEKRLHTQITVHQDTLARFRSQLSSIKIIRSAELVTVAYAYGLLDEYVDGASTKTAQSVASSKKGAMLESLLWAMKLNGCAISEKNIASIIALEK